MLYICFFRQLTFLLLRRNRNHNMPRVYKFFVYDGGAIIYYMNEMKWKRKFKGDDDVGGGLVDFEQHRKQRKKNKKTEAYVVFLSGSNRNWVALLLLRCAHELSNFAQRKKKQQQQVDQQWKKKGRFSTWFIHSDGSSTARELSFDELHAAAFAHTHGGKEADEKRPRRLSSERSVFSLLQK